MNSEERYFQALGELFDSYDPEKFVDLRFEKVLPDQIAVASSYVGQDSERRKYRSSLEQLRANFWNLEPTECSHRIQYLQKSIYPEIKASANRLNEVHGLRQEMERFLSDDLIHLEFRKSVKKIAVSSFQESNEVKNQTLSYLRPGNSSGDSQVYHDIWFAADRVKNEFPSIYQLEPGWFEQIVRYHPDLDRTSAEAPTQVSFLYITLFGFTISVCYYLFRWIFS